MIPILYFHGFASSPRSAKITALRPMLEPHGIELVTPDLNVPSFAKLDWNAIVALGVSEARRAGPRAIVGSSLGALVTLAVARALGEAAPPLVLIAPALGIADRWKEQLPPGDPIVVYNYAEAAEAPVHRAFFEQMIALRVDREPPAGPVTVIMGRRDETVPFDRVAATWRAWEAAGLAVGSKFIEIPEGDHALTAWTPRIAAEIRECLSPSRAA